jgi:hypothetical protein
MHGLLSACRTGPPNGWVRKEASPPEPGDDGGRRCGIVCLQGWNRGVPRWCDMVCRMLVGLYTVVLSAHPMTFFHILSANKNSRC